MREVVLPDGFPVLSPDQMAARLVGHEQATGRLHERLRELVSESTFDLWLSSVQIVGAEGDTVFALVPYGIASWVRDRFQRVLDGAAGGLAGRPIKVVLASAGGAA